MKYRDYDGSAAIDRVLDRMDDLSLNQCELAELMHMSVSQLNSILVRQRFGVAVLIDFCTALNVTPDYILGYLDK